MAKERVERRLAAILAIDVVGYSRLMGIDETGTLAAFKQHRTKLIDPAIADNRGRIVKLTGDGVLAEFGSAVDAVECAVRIQKGMLERNIDTPEARRIVLRIGVNLGDIIIDSDDIHGDGVNVASRLEGLAEPGGVCISAKVYEEVHNKLDVTFEDLGSKDVKNISAPVRVYRVTPLHASSDPSAAALPLPDKPSIAVLPFQNISGDADQEYFADGLAEDIITVLSRFHWFFVIARNSSFAYKGSAVDVRKVARELGVQYVLEGSVRRAASRVRVTGQLIDALSGRHVWADRYDRDLDDIFALQDELTEAIVGAVAPSFVSAEAKRIERKAPESFDAWDYAIRGNWHLAHSSKDDIRQARSMFEKALELDPKSTLALGGLASTLVLSLSVGLIDDPEEASSLAYNLAQKAVDLDESDAGAHLALAMTLRRRKLNSAITTCRRALELNPNFAGAEAWLGILLSWRGDYDNAVAHAQKAIRLNPRDGYSTLSGAIAEFGAGRYEQSADWARKTIQLIPEYPAGWRYLVAALAHVGRLDEARAAKDQLLINLPNESLSLIRAALPSDTPERMERLLDGLRKAEVPE